MKDGHNVIEVGFVDDSNAYAALSKLRQADRAGRVVVLSAAVVTRGYDGVVSAPESDEAVIGAGIMGGGLLGLLVGILGGPVGVVVGWGTGTLAGSYFDLQRGDREDKVLRQISELLPVGRTVLVAEVEEYAEEVVDGEMLPLGGTIVRIPAAEVLAALESAEEAAKAAEHEAHKVLREQRKQEHEAKLAEIEATWNERLDDLGRKLTGKHQAEKTPVSTGA